MITAGNWVSLLGRLNFESGICLPSLFAFTALLDYNSGEKKKCFLLLERNYHSLTSVLENGFISRKMSYSMAGVICWAWAQNHMMEEIDFVQGSVCHFKMRAATLAYVQASNARSAQWALRDTGMDLADRTQGCVGVCTFPEWQLRVTYVTLFVAAEVPLGTSVLASELYRLGPNWWQSCLSSNLDIAGV